MRRLLIISPYFPPINAADAQRVRMSLPYFKELGWEAEIVTVLPVYTNFPVDELLVQSVPADTRLHFVKAMDQNFTGRFGLGSVALRSLPYYRTKVDQLLSQQKFDLIYFSTTQFPVCILGPYWKKKYKVPFVIDMQDPWYSDYYKERPKSERPPKYWFSGRLNKFMENITMKQVDGLISVSENYIAQLQRRYPETAAIPTSVITFGAFEPDIAIAKNNSATFRNILTPGFKNLVYIGRGGKDMYAALSPLFKTLAKGIEEHPELFRRLKLYFIGTSYAAPGEGTPTISPLANTYKVQDQVVEITDRISYYDTLNILLHADALLIPGSDDPAYTASKIFPYLSVNKPLLALIHPQSPAWQVFDDYGLPTCYSYDSPGLTRNLLDFMTAILTGANVAVRYRPAGCDKYSARVMAARQVSLFNDVLARRPIV